MGEFRLNLGGEIRPFEPFGLNNFSMSRSFPSYKFVENATSGVLEWEKIDRQLLMLDGGFKYVFVHPYLGK